MTATYVPYQPTERQEKRLAELAEECLLHGFEYVPRSHMVIAPRPEHRPGRGCDIDVSFTDSDYTMTAFIDVYGNGCSPAFARVEWFCYGEDDLCDLCMDDDEGDS